MGYFSFKSFDEFFLKKMSLPSLLEILLLKRFKQSNVYTSRENKLPHIARIHSLGYSNIE